MGTVWQTTVKSLFWDWDHSQYNIPPPLDLFEQVSLYIPLNQFDVRVVLHQHKRAPISEEEVEGGQRLATRDTVKATAGVGDVKIFPQRHVVLQNEAETMDVEPFLPARHCQRQ